MLPLGIKLGLEDAPERARLEAGVSASPIVNERAGVAEFALIDWSAIPEMVGGIFAAGTA